MTICLGTPRSHESTLISLTHKAHTPIRFVTELGGNQCLGAAGFHFHDEIGIIHHNCVLMIIILYLLKDATDAEFLIG